MKISYPEKNNNTVQDLKFRNQYGKYLFGSNNTFHGGIHIEQKDAPIFAIADGRIIAYRFTEEYQRQEISEGEESRQYAYSNCLVLIQHDLEVEKKDGENREEKKIHTFYSLYHHLMPLSDLRKQSEIPVLLKSINPTVVATEGFEYQKTDRKGLNARILDRLGKVRNGAGGVKIVIPKDAEVSKCFDEQGQEIKIGSYAKVKFEDVDGMIYEDIYICTSANEKKKTERVKDNGNIYKIITTEDQGKWEDKTIVPKEKRNLKGARVRSSPTSKESNIVDIIPFGEAISIELEDGNWCRIAGYSGVSHKENFKLQPHYDESRIMKDSVVACDIAIQGGTLIGYTGKLESETAPSYSTCHLEVFMAGSDVSSFLKNDFGAGNNAQDLHYAIMAKGTVLEKTVESDVNLRKGFPVKIIALENGYAQIQTQECIRNIPNVEGLIYTGDFDKMVKNNKLKGYYTEPKGYHIINFEEVNKIFDGLLTKEDSTLIWEKTICEDRGRRVVFKPQSLEKSYWVKLEELNLASYEVPSTRLVLRPIQELFDFKSMWDYIKKESEAAWSIFEEVEYMETRLREGKVGDLTSLKNTLNRAYLAPPSAGTKTSETLSRQVLVDLKGCQTVKSGTKEYIRLRCSYRHNAQEVVQEGWVETNFERFSAYDWEKFGFTQLDGGSDYLYKLEDNDGKNFLLRQLWKEFDIKKADGIVDQSELELAYRSEQTQERISKQVCQHKLEWSYTPEELVQH
ncbi:MAG: SH3 domain-containing protein, partial [Mangrovibacterium sp.]